MARPGVKSGSVGVRKSLNRLNRLNRAQETILKTVVRQKLTVLLPDSKGRRRPWDDGVLPSLRSGDHRPAGPPGPADAFGGTSPPEPPLPVHCRHPIGVASHTVPPARDPEGLHEGEERPGRG